MAIVRKQCSGCLDEFRLDTSTLKVTMQVPSNGLRGSKHVPAHVATAEAELGTTAGVPMLFWECPQCGYFESEYEEDDVRRALSS